LSPSDFVYLKSPQSEELGSVYRHCMSVRDRTLPASCRDDFASGSLVMSGLVAGALDSNTTMAECTVIRLWGQLVIPDGLVNSAPEVGTDDA